MLVKARKQPLLYIWRSLQGMRRRDSSLIAATVVAAAIAAWLLYEPLALLWAKAFDVRAWILSFGSLAPLIYILLFSAQILIAPLPGNFLGVIGGYLFGVLPGTLYGIVGLTLGAGLAMLLARRFGRPLLERFFAPDDLKLWENRLRMKSPITWTMLFVFPVPDLVFYVAGMTTVPLRTLLLTAIIGRGIGLILANTLGYWSAVLPPEWVAVKWIALAILGILVYLNQRRIRLVALRSTRRVQQWVRQRRQAIGAPASDE